MGNVEIVSGTLIGGGVTLLGAAAGMWLGAKGEKRSVMIMATHLGAIIGGGAAVMGFSLPKESSFFSGIKIAAIAMTIICTSLRIDSKKIREGEVRFDVIKLNKRSIEGVISGSLLGGLLAWPIGMIAYHYSQSMLFAELSSLFWGNAAAFLWKKMNQEFKIDGNCPIRFS